MNKIEELRKRTNPIFNTAKATLYTLAMSGYKDAVLFAEKLGITADKVVENDEQKNAMTKANLAIMEARYRTMNNFIDASGKDIILDLPCGYTPRALYMTSKGKKYIGCDLPAAIDELKPVADQILSEQGVSGAGFFGVDATNYQSLRAALDNVSGELCISTEGLLMYFNNSEVDALCDNIRRILMEFGGCWITPDPESASNALNVMIAILGRDAMKILESSRNSFSQKADIALGENGMMLNFGEESSRVGTYLKSRGLKGERVMMGTQLPELDSLSDMPEAVREAVKNVYNNTGVWVITADKDYDASSDNKTESGGFSADMKVNGDKLMMTLSGRVDSITAPQMLGAYESIAADRKFEGILADCSALEYISSAGLRVLMIMAKQHPDKVRLMNVQPDVKAVLEQTGFDNIIEII